MASSRRTTNLRAPTIALATILCAPALAETVVVGVPDWPSAQVTAHIVGKVLEERYDLDVKLREIGTIELFDAMDRGEVDVHPEIWLPNLEPFVEDYVKDRGTIALSPNSVEASQHICTTRETADATGLRAVSDLADPEMAAKFDTDMDGLGEMWIGANTWSSTRVERVRAKSYGYDETMMLLTMPEEVAMASVDAAVATGAPIVFFCYAPHHLFELHDIVVLDEPAYDPAGWAILTPEQDPGWLSKSKAETAWQPSTFQLGYATELAADHADVTTFLEKVALTPEEATRMSYAIEVERRSPEDVASEWLTQNGERIEEWTR